MYVYFILFSLVLFCPLILGLIILLSIEQKSLDSRLERNLYCHLFYGYKEDGNKRSKNKRKQNIVYIYLSYFITD